jgi:O-antigen/teichoic acid export membrane protein
MPPRYLRHLTRHRDFIGQVATIVSGRTFAAAVSLVLTPIVARLYSPDDFGVAALFIGIAGIGAQVASLKYEAAIALPKDDGEAIQIAVLAYCVLPVVCVVLLGLAAALWFGGIEIGAIDLLGGWIWLLPITILLMAAQDVQECWLSRKLRFGVVGRSVVLDISVGQVSRIAFGLAGPSSVAGLIVGQLAGVIARLVMQGRASVERFTEAFRRANWSDLRSIAIRYSDFARLNAPASFLYSASQNLPVVLFAGMFSPAAAGYFAMANRLSKAPVQIVATSVRRVFLQRAARIHNEGRSLRRSLGLITLGLFAIGAVPALVLWLYGQPVLAFLLGSKWLGAGHFVELIAPWALSAWISAPSNAIFIVMRQQRLWLWLQVATTAVRLSAFPVGFALGFDADRTLAVFVSSSVAVNLLLIAISFRLAGRSAAPGARPA